MRILCQGFSSNLFLDVTYLFQQTYHANVTTDHFVRLISVSATYIIYFLSDKLPLWTKSCSEKYPLRYFTKEIPKQSRGTREGWERSWAIRWVQHIANANHPPPFTSASGPRLWKPVGELCLRLWWKQGNSSGSACNSVQTLLYHGKGKGHFL